MGDKLDKKTMKDQMEKMTIRLGVLQRRAREVGLPILIAFEGWEASGKGTQISELLQALDPRGYQVHVAESEHDESRQYPYWRRFWVRTPAVGRIHIFDKSWCLYAIEGLYKEKLDVEAFAHACQEINIFERQLSDAGTLVVKFFLQISKKEQKKRFEALQSEPVTSWRISKSDWEQNQHYDAWQASLHAVMERTASEEIPWRVIDASNQETATFRIFEQLIEAMEKAVVIHEISASEEPGTPFSSAIRLPGDAIPSALEEVDLTPSISKKHYASSLKKWQNRLKEMENSMYRGQVPLMVLYEGWDAAGKGGNIRRMTAPLDPRGYDVVPIAAPSDVERAHHYLWRFWNAVPRNGHITILDRTWYGRVLVERVEGFCTEGEWKRAYREINEMEAQLVDAGVHLVKFWLHIDQDEQLKRFEDRMEVPWKQWKITDEDWRNREKWSLYRDAVDEMLFRTSTPMAPWTVIEANDKRYARMKAIKTVVRTMEPYLEEGRKQGRM